MRYFSVRTVPQIPPSFYEATFRNVVCEPSSRELQVHQRVNQHLLTHSRSSVLFTRTRGLIGNLTRVRHTTELLGLISWVPLWRDLKSGNCHIRTSFSCVPYTAI